jgi:hypothetical protein
VFAEAVDESHRAADPRRDVDLFDTEACVRGELVDDPAPIGDGADAPAGAATVSFMDVR